jgi:uncharacterized surface protein with fasciclin (FAS1) repeats
MKLALCFVAALSAGIDDHMAPMVGGAPMSPQRNIVQNAMDSKDHTTLVAAVKAAGLAETLMGDGPFTVFAPTNAAFVILPMGTVDTLLKPENKTKLQGILLYHVVPGKWDAKRLIAEIRKGNGTATLTTASGGKLMAMLNGPMNVVLKDAQGNTASISTYDVMQKNGVIHVVTSVLMP